MPNKNQWIYLLNTRNSDQAGWVGGQIADVTEREWL